MRLAYKWQAALVVALGLFMAILDTTIVSVALPDMQAYFHTNRDTITWVATGYILANAAVIPITGYLADRIGSKTVFLTALVFFTIGSGLCAIAPSENWLIAFRVLQGIGGGALLPIAFAIVFRVFPPAERGGASAVIGVPILLAPAFGPTIGGYFTTHFDWHAIFTINLPIGVIAFALASLVLRGRVADADGEATGEVPRDTGRFDWAGLLLSMTGFTAVVYGISAAGNSSWTDTKVLTSLIGGSVLLVIFTIVELRVSDPVMDVRLFRNYTFASTNVLVWLISGFLFGGIYLLPIFFQTVQSHSPLESGEYVIVQGLGAAITTAVAGRLYNVVGPKILAIIGFVLVTAGTWGFTQLTPTTTWQSLQVWLFVRGLGLGLTNIPLQTLVLSVVSNRAMARASSLVNVTRQAFGAVGLTVLTTVFAQRSTAYTQAYSSQVTAATKTYVTQQVSTATNAAVAAYTAGSPTDPSTPLGQLTAQCAAPFGVTAQQHAAQIQACVQTNVQHYAQSFAQTYAQQHASQLAASYAARYLQQNVLPFTLTHALNDAFLISFFGCAAGIVLAFFLGSDPSLKAAREARARGEKIEPRPMPIGE
jgi:EmrB/QacA subfamily drug resistance transporter